MTGADLRSALEELEFSQLEFAQLIDADGRTVRRWLSGEVVVPGSVSLLIKLLTLRPELVSVARKISSN